MPPADLSHGIAAPLLALVVVCVLGVLSGWVFGRSRASHRRLRERRDFGLLVPVATVPDPAAADRLQRLLASNGIRGTVAPSGGPVQVSAEGDARPPGLHVLVFPTDAERARALLG